MWDRMEGGEREGGRTGKDEAFWTPGRVDHDGFTVRPMLPLWAVLNAHHVGRRYSVASPGLFSATPGSMVHDSGQAVIASWRGRVF